MNISSYTKRDIIRSNPKSMKNLSQMACHICISINLPGVAYTSPNNITLKGTIASQHSEYFKPQSLYTFALIFNPFHELYYERCWLKYLVLTVKEQFIETLILCKNEVISELVSCSIIPITIFCSVHYVSHLKQVPRAVIPLTTYNFTAVLYLIVDTMSYFIFIYSCACHSDMIHTSTISVTIFFTAS